MEHALLLVAGQSSQPTEARAQGGREAVGPGVGVMGQGAQCAALKPQSGEAHRPSHCLMLNQCNACYLQMHCYFPNTVVFKSTTEFTVAFRH